MYPFIIEVDPGFSLVRSWPMNRESDRGGTRLSRVLVIDDEAVIGTILRYAFEVGGHETVFADGGRAGIDRARSEHPDAIVLDLMMPAVNGYDVLATLRAEDATRDVPILVLTAVTLSRDRQRCLSGGADLVMTKPFDPRDVASAVDDLLSSEPSAASGA
jgi:CheY-like chemotaxis protein